MDLTNIEPCVDCKNYNFCMNPAVEYEVGLGGFSIVRPEHHEEVAAKRRLCSILVHGKDCFDSNITVRGVK